MNKSLLEIKDLTKIYHTKNGEIKAIDNISFNLYEKEFLCIVGSSGCGKSTLLNILANLDEKSDGQIKKNKNLKIGYMLQEDALFPWLTILENATLGLEIKNLKIGYMLQEDALFPWLTILENATLGLEIKKIKTKENIEYVKELLTKYGLKDFINKYPSQLSGGMRQRVV